MEMVGIVVGSNVTTVAVIDMIWGGSVGGTKKVGVEDGAQAFSIKGNINKATRLMNFGVMCVFITPKILSWGESRSAPH